MQRIISKPNTIAVSMATLKKHCRVVVDDDNDLIEMYAKAAQIALFQRTGVCAQPFQFETLYSDWDSCVKYNDPFKMLAFPFRSVDLFEYRDVEGTYTEIIDDNFQAVKTYYGAYLDFIDDFTFPDLYADVNSNLVRIKFTAGYDNEQLSGSGDDPEYHVPENVQMAILFLVGHWYNNREDVVDEEKFTVPKAFDFIANQLRIYS